MNTLLVKYLYPVRNIQVVPLFHFLLCITKITQMGLIDIGRVWTLAKFSYYSENTDTRCVLESTLVFEVNVL